MKTRVMMVLAVLGLALTLTMTRTAPAAAGAPEPHPHIRAALHELREARNELKTAAHDFGGFETKLWRRPIRLFGNWKSV